jgi:hypothetical protein
MLTLAVVIKKCKPKSAKKDDKSGEVIKEEARLTEFDQTDDLVNRQLARFLRNIETPISSSK